MSDDTANRPAARGFLLLGFSEVRGLRPVQAALFLPVFLAALTGNLLIVAVTVLDRRLHTPLYFLLGNLALVDLRYVSVTVPKSIPDSLSNGNSVSPPACAAQVFLVIFLIGSEMALPTVTSHDRLVAVCRPLRYDTVVHRGACASVLAASWLSSGLNAALYATGVFSLSFCAPNVVHQFLCDGPQSLRLACSSGQGAQKLSLATTVGLPFFCSVLVVVSYARIFRAVLRMPAAEGRGKAFSTCPPHLAVVTLLVTSGSSAYLKPISDSPSALELKLSVFYSVLPPTLNPLIYSLRNRDVKMAMEKLLGQKPPPPGGGFPLDDQLLGLRPAVCRNKNNKNE
ncbi:olfactory receptor 14A16-like [Ornithorhynchus anatinus]|uniref:olfactory receptor 14A16-like n=1 Tax=Ornithorhynchus anatinus TaxID=9258 RepID=UPI0010A94A2E|nr:olfactory receptor 14A16-like [Ornithorhynchus anatinus]